MTAKIRRTSPEEQHPSLEDLVTQAAYVLSLTRVALDVAGNNGTKTVTESYLEPLLDVLEERTERLVYGLDRLEFRASRSEEPSR